LSFRQPRFQRADLDSWRAQARQRLGECLLLPDSGGVPGTTLQRRLQQDGLEIERLTWQLPYGPPTEALFLKPAGAVGRLPAILALHDHGGKKYFGWRKICRPGDDLHPMMERHQQEYYGGAAWANAIARRGYAVLVHDAFPFGSRRVRAGDVPPVLRGDLTEANPEDEQEIEAYQRWAANHEHIMAKSLFCAGTTWPGVFLGEDMRALDYLCSRSDVDPERVGCGGLSGGGMRTVYLAGSDDRIACAVCVGMMSTWRDYLLNKCYTHTWMVYTPGIPRDLDYSEILGLRVPLPTLVQNDREDSLFTMPEMERADRMLAEVYAK